MADPVEVAQCLRACIDSKGSLRQSDARTIIEQKFGSAFLTVNKNGNQAIHRDVLKELRAATSGTVVWDRSLRGWRLRRPEDPAGRRAN